MFSTRALLVVGSFASVVRAEFQVGVHAEFQPLVKSGVAVFARVPHLHQKLVQ